MEEPRTAMGQRPLVWGRHRPFTRGVCHVMSGPVIDAEAHVASA